MRTEYLNIVSKWKLLKTVMKQRNSTKKHLIKQELKIAKNQLEKLDQKNKKNKIVVTGIWEH